MMALRTLMLKKELDTKRKAFVELEKRSAEFETRNAELEQAIEEAENAVFFISVFTKFLK